MEIGKLPLQICIRRMCYVEFLLVKAIDQFSVVYEAGLYSRFADEKNVRRKVACLKNSFGGPINAHSLHRSPILQEYAKIYGI